MHNSLQFGCFEAIAANQWHLNSYAQPSGVLLAASRYAGTYITTESLSMLVLNSGDWHENLWLPQKCV